MNKKLLITGSILGVIAVILGAFASHGLEEVISAKSLKSFQVGVRYQMYHAFLLLIVGGTSFLSRKLKTVLFYLVLIGVTCFSGSIYGLATNDLTVFNFKTIALITPLGGLLLILGWVMLLIGAVKSKRINQN